MQLRIGNGYDMHRLVPGRPLILGADMGAAAPPRASVPRACSESHTVVVGSTKGNTPRRTF